MLKNLSALMFVLLISALVCHNSYCESIKAEKLVDQFYKETDLEKAHFAQTYKDDKIIVSAEVRDVKEEDTFDVVNDIKRRYYKVVTKTQKTAGDNDYAVILIYKNADKVRDIAKGQWVTKEGKLLRVVDEGLLLSVWLYEENLTKEERELFK